MTTRLAGLLLLAVIAVVACGSAPVTPGATSTRSSNVSGEAGVEQVAAEAPGYFSLKKAMAHVRKLAGEIGVRVRGRPGERQGALYIAEQFSKLGYETKIQKFSVDDRTSRNVVAWWPDARRYPMIIGGHMDSVPTSPGANDNASGVAVVLEMARIIAGREQARYVRFVAFGSEEYGTDGRHHVGSQVFVNRLGDTGRKRLAGMISVDMVADGRPLIVGTADIGPEIVARTLYRKIDRKNIAVTYRNTCDCSDNGPFELVGIPAAFAWSGPEENYHDSSDTVANMVPEDLRRTGRAIRALVVDLSQAMLDRFRRR